MTVRRILQHIAPFTPYTTGAEALACFAADPALRAAAVVDGDGLPLGLVARTPLRMKLADKSGHEMFAGAPVTAVMDSAPLIVEDDTDLNELCDEILAAYPQAFHDGFIVTHDGRYLGLGGGLSLLASVRSDNNTAKERLGLAMKAARAAVWEVDFERAVVIGADKLEPIYNRTLTFDDVRRLSPDFVAPEDREAMRKALVEIAGSVGRGTVRCRFRRADGAERWVEHAVETFRGEDQSIARMVLLTADITQRRRMELTFQEALERMEAVLGSKPAAPGRTGARQDEEAEFVRERLTRIFNEIVIRDQALVAAADAAAAASEAKSRFLASMSHELRTPLNAILGYSEILDEDLTAADMPGPASDAQRIRGSARHLLHLINEILDLSKIEAGRMDVSAESFDVAALARDVIATVRPLADKNSNTLTVSLSPDLGQCYTDSVKLNQCLMNLLSNACKFTRAGEVRLTAQRKTLNGRESLLFEVSDSGIGMNDEQMAKLFQAFTQADASTTRNYGGTGLGLAITQRLAQLLGGDVSVTSALGAGAKFTLHVPAHFALPGGARGADSGIEIASDRPTVLVIDDDQAARDLVRRALSRLGFAITEAATGEAGLSAARARRYALIVLDIQLPDISGWKVLETLKRDPALADTPVMMLSIEDERARALALGACELIVKPADRDVLAATAVRFARFDTVREPSDIKNVA